MTTKLLTADDVARLPDDGYRYDLIRGELIRMTAPGGEHGEIGSELGAEIRNFVRAHSLGRTYAAETGFLLARDPDVLLGPDVAFIRAERLPPREQRRGYIAVAPDLVVEIISPSDRLTEVEDVEDKATAYLDHGVRLVWVVNPRRRTVMVYRADGTARLLREGDDLDGEEVLPGFRLPVASIFA